MAKLLCGLLAAMVVAAAAQAAKPGPAYSISLDQAAPAFGDKITFIYTPDPATGNIVVECFQAGVLVSSEQHAANTGGWSYHTAFTLGGTYLWTSGPADCVATLSVLGKGHKMVDAASTAFSVTGG